MTEDKNQAYEDGLMLAHADTEYRRNWPCPYVTGAARWAMVQGYEDGWQERRAPLAGTKAGWSGYQVD